MSKIENKSIFKIAILNDIIACELGEIEIDKIEDNDTKCKLRNLRKSTQNFTSFTDEKFKTSELQEVFGDFCDQIDNQIDENLKILE